MRGRGSEQGALAIYYVGIGFLGCAELLDTFVAVYKSERLVLGIQYGRTASSLFSFCFFKSCVRSFFRQSYHKVKVRRE